MRRPKQLKERLVLAVATVLALALCAAWLTGCESDVSNPLVPSLRPLYTTADLDSDSGLTGSWSDQQDDIKMVFEPDGQNQSYKFTVIESDNGVNVRGQFTAHLVRLGSARFLDLFPGELKDGDDLFKLHFLRAHSFARIDLNGDKLRLALLSGDWLKDRIADKTVDTPHEMADGSILLTGSIEDLQDLVYRYSDDTNAFSIEVNLVRDEEKASD